MRRNTSPNWPAPPLCFLWRWWPSAFAGDGLAVGDLRRPRRHLEAIGLAQPLEQNAQVQLAETVDDRLVGAGDVLELQARVLVDELGQDLPHALLVAVALGLDRQAVHGPRERHRREVDVVVLGGVVQDGVELDLVDLGDRDDVAGQRLRDLDMVLALEHEEMRDLERLSAVADVEEAVLRDRPLVDAKDAEPADEGIDRDLEDVREHVPARLGQGRRHRLGRGALAAQERRRVRLAGMRQQLDDDVEQLGDADAGLRGDEADRDQVAFAQRLLERCVQLGGVDVAVVEVAVDEVGVDLDDLLDERPVRRVDAAEIAVALAVVEAVDDARAAGVGQVERQAFLAERVLDLRQHAGQVDAGHVDPVDDDHAIALARRGVLHHAHRHRLDADRRVDHDRRRLHRLERGQALAEEVGRARRVDEVDARLAARQVQHARVERVLHAPLERVEVADLSCRARASRRDDSRRRRRAAPRRGWSCRRRPGRRARGCGSIRRRRSRRKVGLACGVSFSCGPRAIAGDRSRGRKAIMKAPRGRSRAASSSLLFRFTIGFYSGRHPGFDPLTMRSRLGLSFLLGALCSVSAFGADEARWTNASEVNLRSEPGTRGAVLALLPLGTAVRWIATSEGSAFCEVDVAGTRGFVACRFLSAAPTVPGAGAAGGPTGRWVTGAGVNLRAEPSPQSAVIARLALNARVELLATVADSPYCEVAAGVPGAAWARGYTACRYLATTPVAIDRIVAPVLPDGQPNPQYDPARAFWLAPSWAGLEAYGTQLGAELKARHAIAPEGPMPSSRPADAEFDRMKAHLAKGIYGATPPAPVRWDDVRRLARTARGQRIPAQSSPGERERIEGERLVAQRRLAEILALWGPAFDATDGSGGGVRLAALVATLELPMVAPSLFKSPSDVAPPGASVEDLSGRFHIVTTYRTRGRDLGTALGTVDGLWDIGQVTAALTQPVVRTTLSRDGRLRTTSVRPSETRVLWGSMDPPMCEGYVDGFAYGEADPRIWRYFGADAQPDPEALKRHPPGTLVSFATKGALPLASAAPAGRHDPRARQRANRIHRRHVAALRPRRRRRRRPRRVGGHRQGPRAPQWPDPHRRSLLSSLPREHRRPLARVRHRRVRLWLRLLMHPSTPRPPSGGGPWQHARNLFAFTSTKARSTTCARASR
jgi:hypothetical protein